MDFTRRPLPATLLLISLGLLCITVAARPPQSGASDYQVSLKAASNLMRQGKFDDAVQEYRNAVKLSGGNEYAPYWGLAQTYNQLNDKLNTLEACDRMIALAPTDVIKAQCHNLKGLALAKGGSSDPAGLAAAETEFREAIKLDPDYSAQYFNLGKTLLFEKRIPEGTEQLKAYLSKDPDGADSDEANQLVKDPSTVGQVPAETEADDTSAGDFTAADADALKRSFVDKPDAAKSRPVPAFTMKNAHGDKITQETFRGKVVLVDFWASWCGVCNESFPDLNKIYNDVNKQKFVLLSIDVDLNEREWKKSLELHKPEWMQARDGTGWIMHRMAPDSEQALPTYVLIDRDGNIQLAFEGWGNGIRDRLETLINYWIDAPSSPAGPAKKSN